MSENVEIILSFFEKIVGDEVVVGQAEIKEESTGADIQPRLHKYTVYTRKPPHKRTKTGRRAHTHLENAFTKNTKPQKLANQNAIHQEHHTDRGNDNKKQ